MKKFLKWFIIDSNVKWSLLLELIFLSIMIYNNNGEMLGIIFGCVVVFVTLIGVAKFWLNLLKMEKEGKVKL